ncbi:hypothetical protein [Mangrovivirga cuniculi]|uniref:Uncharacterized protein n=1 Tax=Mangrovivirga cuniculi TaxID=2715131 RepID=A0A4D7K907_9BACT|nr:hypothetical protein [Mangrovivirga cuniculi]QCK15778.1 hypothetical protein DCC35_14000 [Mangrovivirga cuniculi]
MAKKESIKSLKELQVMMPELVKKYGNDQKIVLGALANPILALEELGYSISAKAKTEIEERIKYGPEGKKEFEKIEKKIQKTAGKSIDPNSNKDLSKYFEKKLGDEFKLNKKKVKTADLIRLINKPPDKRAILIKNRDPLEKYKKADDLIPLLIEYREMKASVPELAPKPLYKKITAGKMKSGISFSKMKIKMNKSSKAATRKTKK